MTSYLLQFRGGWNAAPNTDEAWQFGLRLWIDTSVPDNSGLFPDTEVTPLDDSGTAGDYDWSTNWAIEGLDDLGPQWDRIEGAALTFWQSATTFVSTSCVLTSMRLYPIDNAGKVVQLDNGAAVSNLIFHSPQAGSSSAALLPLEVAAVATFDTYRTGPKGRGRFYVPGITTGALGTQGRWSTDFQGNLAENTAGLLSDIALESPTPTALHIRPVVTGPSGFNRYSVIKQVRSGSVPDAQRRRRNRVAETYVPAEVVYG